MLTVFFFILGLAILTGGAEFLVRGASQFSRRLGVAPLIVGLTVVAFGTSAPELAVSVKSALAGQADIALGNVLGSNILNILLILGLSALIVPLTISRQLVQVDLFVMIGSAVLAWLFALDGSISRIEGLILFAGIFCYLAFQFKLAKANKALADSLIEEGTEKPLPAKLSAYVFDFIIATVGLIMLVYGANMMVNSAVIIARNLGISELVIGLTIVAVGTSMPEVAASLMASLRGERDLAVGNIVGSNIFNILAVLGPTAAISKSGIGVSPSALQFDFPFMLLVSFICLPIFFTGKEITRKEGALLLACYIAYTVILILIATGRAVLPW
ncbi:MAG: calcium/sodium antiporter [Sumerlaeia bacterium]